MGGEKNKGQKYTKTPAADMSRLFALKNVELEYLDPQDGDVGTPDSSGWDASQGAPLNTKFVHKPLTNRWVYVFQRLGDNISWFAECWLDEKGSIHPVDMKQAKDKERNKRPAPAKEADRLRNRLTLPHTINGKRVYYAFYVGGTRLALESIHKLEQPENFKMLFKSNGMDLKEDKTFRHEEPKTAKNSPPIYGPADDDAYILVFDPLRYGMSANRILQKVRDREVAWVVPAKDLDARQRERTTQRQKKLVLATTIKALLDGDSKDKLGIKKKIHADQLENWLRDYKEKTDAKKANVSALAGHITGFLMQHWHMQFAVESSLALVKADPDGGAEDLARFVQEYAACMERLIETDPGVSWLTQIVGDKSHFVHSLVMDTSKSPRLYVQAFGKAPGAFYKIFTEVFIPYRAKYGLAFRKTMVDPCYGTISGTEVSVDLEAFQWTNKTGHIVTVQRNADIRVRFEDAPPGHSGGRVGDPSVDGHASTQPGGGSPDPHATPVSEGDQALKTAAGRITIMEVREQYVTTTHTPTNWSKNFSEEAVTRIKNALQDFAKVITALNMGLAVYDLGDQGINKWTLLNAAKSLGSVITSFEILTTLSSQALRRIAFVTAIFDAVLSLHNAVKAVERGDNVAAIGFTVTALGSGMAAAGVGMAIIGIETSWTGIGLVVALVGAIIAFFGGSPPETEIQLFAKHCVWGTSYGEDEDKAAIWQVGSFSGWHESKPYGLDNQIQTMFNLLQSFSIAGRAWTVRIQLGMYEPASKLHVQLEPYMDGWKDSNKVEIVVDLGRNRTRVVDPKDPGRRDTGGASVEYGGDYVEIKMDFPGKRTNPDYPGSETDKEMTVWVYLDIKGDGSQVVPRTYPGTAYTWVDYHSKALSEVRASRSLDY